MPKKNRERKPPEWIDVATLANRWGYGVQTVYEKIERGEIPVLGVRPYRIPLKWVQAMEAAADKAVRHLAQQK